MKKAELLREFNADTLEQCASGLIWRLAQSPIRVSYTPDELAYWTRCIAHELNSARSVAPRGTTV